MSKREKAFWFLAYTVIAVLTLLPFFHVGFTTADDFQYYNVARESFKTWLSDAQFYAENTGRFYFLVTKYLYYIPYLIDSFVWTKFVQYSSLLICYLLFAYVIYRIFHSGKLGLLTLLLLLSFPAIGTGWHYPPAAYPFYFSFSLTLFLAGILLYINYVERKGYWRIIVGSLLFFLSFLFYEEYLVFALFFCMGVICYHWQKSGFINMLKTKSVFQELIPYALALILYTICYITYRYFLSHKLGYNNPYSGAAFANQFNISNFFQILNNCTFYAMPCSHYGLDETRELMAVNSPLISGHYNNLSFILTHAPAIAYVNALIQCGILWFLTRKYYFKKISWTAIIMGIVAAIIFAYSAHFLIAITDKYNTHWFFMPGYVTSFFSYFGVILTIALLMTALLKVCRTKHFIMIARLMCCLLFFAGSVLSYYMNDLTSKEWKKSQNRVTAIQLIAEKQGFDNIPENALIYDEQLHNTSETAFSICNGTLDFEDLIMRLTKRHYNFSTLQEYLLQQHAKSPDAPLYFVQATESKKNGDLLMAFSHITHMDTCNTLCSLADEADVYYYSPAKNYVLFYSLYTGTDSVQTKAVTVLSSDWHEKLTHIHIHEAGLNPLGFSISNLITPTTDTLRIP